MLHNQSRPSDLAVVKRSNTPVRAQPADGAYTMLVAWLPGATLWLHDVITGTGLLGRWDGTGPEVMASLDRDLPQWHPAS